MVTWPSAIKTTLASLRTHKTVVPCIVPCISPLFWLLGIPSLYALPSPRAKITETCKVAVVFKDWTTSHQEESAAQSESAPYSDGCQSSTRLPSGSLNHPNFPYSCSSRFASTVAPAHSSLCKT